MADSPAQTRVGISGWTYAPWRGVFYPKGLPQNRELAYASRALNSIEINGTFYSLQKPASFAKWYEETPEGFLFSLKGGRFITHMKKLAGVETALANFFASGVLGLREKLGPILWQLPPSLGYDADRLAKFFNLLPRDTRQAATLAKSYDTRLKANALTKTDATRPMRHAMEVRHDTFKTPEFIALLRKHDIGLVVADTAGKWPYMEDVTADFVYARLHGDEVLYASGYSDDALDEWAAKFKRWRCGREPKDADRVNAQQAESRPARDVYVYFDNDVKVRAPFDAAGLSNRLGLKHAVGDAGMPELTKPAETPRERWPDLGKRPRPSK